MNRKKNINDSYQNLLAKRPERPYTQPPVKPVEFNYKNKFEKFDKGLGLLGYGFEIFKTYVRGYDGDRIKDTRNTVKSYIDEEGGIDTEYEIEFEIEWSGNLKMHSIMPKDFPVIGNKPTYMRYYTEKILIKTKNPKAIYTGNDPILKKMEEDLNKDRKKEAEKKEAEKKEKEMKDDQKKLIDDFKKRVKDDIPLKLGKKIKEYVDPSTDESVRRRGSQA